uniref:Uncharacterized protein n=1 Tax=Magallana gigas TaxID=29159 RepID=K1RXH5_MAGGI
MCEEKRPRSTHASPHTSTSHASATTSTTPPLNQTEARTHQTNCHNKWVSSGVSSSSLKERCTGFPQAFIRVRLQEDAER